MKINKHELRSLARLGLAARRDALKAELAKLDRMDNALRGKAGKVTPTDGRKKVQRRVFWQQTPEGKKKLAAAMKARWAAGKLGRRKG